MRIRKQDFDLTNVDLDRYPVWEYALGEETQEDQNELTVRPIEQSGAVDLATGFFLVRATFCLSDSSQLKGYMKPRRTECSGTMTALLPYDLQPIIVLPGGRIHFCYGAAKPEPETIAKNYDLLGRRRSQVFPVNFVADIEVYNGVGGGTVEGFLYIDKETEDFFNLKSADIKMIW